MAGGCCNEPKDETVSIDIVEGYRTAGNIIMVKNINRISYLTAMAGITSTFSRDGHVKAVDAKGGRSSIV